MRFELASHDRVILYFDEEISLRVSHQVKASYERLKGEPFILQMIPSYHSILIQYDFLNISLEKLQEKILQLLKTNQNAKTTLGALIEVPVYYHEEVGFDLQRVASYANCSIEEVIMRHSQKEYNVFAIGFAPGFAYLGEVDESIALGRLDSPRSKVPKGSVGIANKQTAVYPNDSAGGWNIIGRTPFEFYDKSLEQLIPFSVGDRITFKPISKEQFLEAGGVL